MPVDTSAINTILNAYAQGMQLRQNREAQAFNQQRAIAQQNLQREQLEEETKRHEAALKFQEAKFKADQERLQAQDKMAASQHKLSMIAAKSNIAQHIQSTGITPPGFKRELAGMDPDTDSVYYKYSSEEDPSFSVVLPSGITHAREVAAQQREIMKPKMEFEAQKATADLTREAFKQAATHQSKRLVEQERTKRQEEHDKREYTKAITAASIRARAAKTPAAKAAAEDEKPLSQEEIVTLNRVNPGANLQMGAKRKDAKGLMAGHKLTASQEKDKEFLDSIEEAAMQLQPEIDKNKDYFAGASIGGTLSELKRKALGGNKQSTARMRAILGRLTAVVGNKFFGASFTGGEDERIRAFVPRETKDQDFESVKANLEELINFTRQTRARMFGTAAAASSKIDKAASKYGGAQ